MTKLLILDMDGTVRHPISNPDGFILHPKDQILFPEAIAAMKQFKSKGFTIIGASNQGGVAAGKKSLEDCIAEQAYTLELAYEADVAIDEILFCPDYEGKICLGVDGWKEVRFISSSRDYSQSSEFAPFRKPHAGMINLAIHLYAHPFDDKEIYFVGDRTEDEQAAKAANVQFIHATEWRSSYWIA
jgi:D-glycero-D-manno-heptose 1,7-bisphosphate phosphatase